MSVQTSCWCNGGYDKAKAEIDALKEENERLTRELADEKLIVTQKSLHIHDIEGRLDTAEARVAELEGGIDRDLLIDRIAELEEELGGWVKSFDDVNARCIALSERYES